MLSSDPEMQRWAQEELKRTTDAIAALTKEKEGLEHQLTESQKRVESFNDNLAQLRTENRIQLLKQRLGNTTAPTGLGNTCTLKVTTEPPDAEVLMEDATFPEEQLGVKSLVVPRILLAITVSKPGFVPRNLTLNLTNGCDPVFVKLTRSRSASQLLFWSLLQVAVQCAILVPKCH